MKGKGEESWSTTWMPSWMMISGKWLRRRSFKREISRLKAPWVSAVHIGVSRCQATNIDWRRQTNIDWHQVLHIDRLRKLHHVQPWELWLTRSSQLNTLIHENPYASRSRTSIDTKSQPRSTARLNWRLIQLTQRKSMTTSDLPSAVTKDRCSTPECTKKYISTFRTYCRQLWSTFRWCTRAYASLSDFWEENLEEKKGKGS